MSREESIIQTDTVRVRVMHLSPGEGTPWHFHNEVTDNMVCLTGALQVKLHQPAEEFKLPPGGRCTVEVRRVHRVGNPSSTAPASYLLIQGVGHYDFNPVDVPEHPPS